MLNNMKEYQSIEDRRTLVEIHRESLSNRWRIKSLLTIRILLFVACPMKKYIQILLDRFHVYSQVLLLK